MLPEGVLKRMEAAQRTVEAMPNCIGTALYVLGLQKEDAYVGPRSQLVERLLRDEDRTAGPKEGEIMVVREGPDIVHAGVVVSEHPPAVYHRPGPGERIVMYDPLIFENYAGYGIEYYMPGPNI